jgi:hypothetical protein
VGRRRLVASRVGQTMLRASSPHNRKMPAATRVRLSAGLRRQVPTRPRGSARKEPDSVWTANRLWLSAISKREQDRLAARTISFCKSKPGLRSVEMCRHPQQVPD